MATQPPRRAVVFDFGGVVVRWDMRALFAPMFASPADMERFLGEVLTPAENLRCDLGTPLATVVGELVARYPRYRAPLEAWRDRWIETIPGEIGGTAELIADLKRAGYLVLGLSNFSAETFPWCRARYRVFDAFDDIVISGETGVAKPDAEAYLTVCRRSGVGPDEAVFFDDSPANVTGAERVGMTAFLFTDAATARTQLASVGVSA